jgi:hypothetical protein
VAIYLMLLATLGCISVPFIACSAVVFVRCVLHNFGCWLVCSRECSFQDVLTWSGVIDLPRPADRHALPETPNALMRLLADLWEDLIGAREIALYSLRLARVLCLLHRRKRFCKPPSPPPSPLDWTPPGL